MDAGPEFRGDRRRPGSASPISSGERFADVADGFTLGRRRSRRGERREGEQPIPPVADETPAARPQWEQPGGPAERADDDAPPSSVRSYTWTGGRTKSNFQLELETLVSTSDSYRPGGRVRMEHQSIAEMCRNPRSVAEVGALMSVPVGVARVLLADMAELGLVTVHHTVRSGTAPHLMLMERVLSGLRQL